MRHSGISSRERLLRSFGREEMDRPGVFVRWGGMDKDTDPTCAELKRLTLEKADLKASWAAR